MKSKLNDALDAKKIDMASSIGKPEVDEPVEEPVVQEEE